MMMYERLNRHSLPLPLPLLLLLLAMLMFLSACAGSRETSGPVEPADELPTPEVNMADFEDFDPSAYREAVPDASERIEHDVPATLMQGTADTGIRSTVQGFRVQVHSTLDKNAAVRQEEDIRAWWRDNKESAPAGTFSNEISVNVVYIQPYYRVRLGNFTSRNAADRARQFIAQRFPDAFIVPDTVTVTR